jgi:Fe-S cluster assembly iron-binding protein IscA
LGLALDEPIEDQLKIINEIPIMVEDRILNYLADVHIDYVANEMGEGFAIIPSNSFGTCG